MRDEVIRVVVRVLHTSGAALGPPHCVTQGRVRFVREGTAPHLFQEVLAVGINRVELLAAGVSRPGVGNRSEAQGREREDGAHHQRSGYLCSLRQSTAAGRMSLHIVYMSLRGGVIMGVRLAVRNTHGIERSEARMPRGCPHIN